MYLIIIGVAFFVGMIVGTIVGFFFASLCIVAGDNRPCCAEDRRPED